MRMATALTVIAVSTCSATASIVQVTIHGTIEQNQISAPPLGLFVAGQAATMSFLVDSDNFVDHGVFPTRGYVIDQSSFVFSSGAASVGLQSPFPAGATPYFVLRNNDPAVDGFFVSTDLGFDLGVPLAQQGIFGAFGNNFSVSYDGSTLASLNILEALGTYDFDGLFGYNWVIEDGPFGAMSLGFESMTITAVPGPGAIAALAAVSFLRTRRRRCDVIRP
jgi:hypothetical protein